MSFNKFIADAPNGLDVFIVRVKLIPDALDIDRNGSDISEFGIPDMAENLLTGQHLSGVFHEILKQLKFTGRKLNRLLIFENFKRTGMYFNISDLDNSVIKNIFAALLAAQVSLDSCNKLFNNKGL